MAQKDPEARRQYLAAWREKQRDHLREYHTEWRGRNRERVTAMSHANYEANKSRHRATGDKWKAENPEKVRESRKRTYEKHGHKKRARERDRYATDQAYREQKKAASDSSRKLGWDQFLARQRKYRRERYRNDPAYRFMCIARARCTDIMLGNAAGGSLTELLLDAFGCPLPELWQRIEGLFEPGMTRDNQSINGWHIDHIRPLSSFDLLDQSQFRQAWHYSNLRPLWAAENRRKGAKWEGDT